MTTASNQPSVGIVERRYYTFAKPPDKLVLESGDELGPVTVAYETYGKLNKQKDNAILITHAFTGDSHVAEHHATDGEEDKPGWWNFMVGPRKGIDTERFFVICPNILGGCMGSTGPSSINPKTDKPYGLDFPVMTVGDMVVSQKALLDHLGISHLRAVIGGSLGGMQVLEWCIRFPKMVQAAIPIATTMRHSALAIAFNEIARQSIMADPNWNNGNYYNDQRPDRGLAVARMVGHVTYLSDEAMRRKFGRRLQDKDAFSFGFGGDFQVESYLHYQGLKFVNRFDANSLLYITKASDYFDVVDQLGKTGPLNGGSHNKYLIISYSSDWLYPTYQARELLQTLKRCGQNVSFCEIEADCGHDAFFIPDEQLSTLIRGFLNGIVCD